MCVCRECVCVDVGGNGGVSVRVSVYKMGGEGCK